MNGYDAQDMAAQGADGFRNGYQAGYADAVKAIEAAQLTAAQEAVAWRDDVGNLYPSKESVDKYLPRGRTVHALYAAPVTAAPADTWFADQLTAMGEVIPLDSTPAAPGIDPHVLARDIHHAIADTGLAPLSPADNYTLREVIRSVIDASPKGAADEPLHAHYCNAQPASAECICGLDSPKGGSEAPTDGEVLVTVSGLTGSGKSAVAGEIEILCKALGLEVEWVESEEEKRLTHADWTEALELYKPRVRIVEVNIPRAQASDAEVRP